MSPSVPITAVFRVFSKCVQMLSKCQSVFKMFSKCQRVFKVLLKCFQCVSAVPLWSASQVQIRERAQKMAPRLCYGGFLVAWVAGAPVAICVPRPEPGRSNVLPVAGKDLGCGGSSLPQVQLAQPTHPQPSCIVITGWNWTTLHNTSRTDGWFVVAENGMGLPVCSM